MKECRGGMLPKILGVLLPFATLFSSFSMLESFSKQLPGVESWQTFGHQPLAFDVKKLHDRNMIHIFSMHLVLTSKNSMVVI